MNFGGVNLIKIVFFDIDGTLLKKGQTQLSNKTAYTLKSLQQKGILLCMATGRSYTAIPHFDAIEFDILLTFNGSYIKTKDKIIYKQPIDPSDKFKIINSLNQMDRAIAISNEKFLITNGTDPNLEQYFAFGNEELLIDPHFNELAKNDIYQIMCSCSKEEYNQILNGTTQTQITAWWDKAVDIIPLDCGKGNAVNKVLNYFNFTKEEAIAFGDGENDIAMLKEVGIGIAMDNANDKVKEIADIICPSVDKDGIYHYCLENKLI